MSTCVRVLFVCMGNICRSPTAHGVFEALVAREGLADCIEVDSAGTHAYHVGEPPDVRTQETARRRGVDLSAQRARQARREDSERFDYILAMDRDNHRALCALFSDVQGSKVRLFMDYAPHLQVAEVPDPYYGGPAGFERVFDMIETAAVGLLADIRQRHF